MTENTNIIRWHLENFKYISLSIWLHRRLGYKNLIEMNFKIVKEIFLIIQLALKKIFQFQNIIH